VGNAAPALRRMPMAALAAALAVAAALQVPTGGLRPGLVLAAAAGGGALLVLFAVRRFELFVLGVLVLRATADAARTAGQGGASGAAATALALLFLLAAALWLAARARAGERAGPRSLLGWSLLALVGAGLASVPGAQDPAGSLAEAARLVAAVAMFLVAEQLLDRPGRPGRVLVAVYASAVVPLTVGFGQVLTGTVPVSTDGFARLRATFVHPNVLGFYLVLLVVMGLALLPHLRGRLRAALAVTTGLAGVALVLTYSRGSWMALVVGVLVAGVLQSRRLLAGLVAVALVIPVAVPSVTARLADLDDERTLRGTGGNSLVWRLDYWGESLALAADRPLTGVGLGMTELLSVSAKPPHNDFLRTYVEAGLLGLLAYLGMLWGLVRLARRALARAAPGLDRGLAVGMAACTAAFLVASAVSNLITGVVVLWYFFALAAAAAAAGDGVPVARS